MLIESRTLVGASAALAIVGAAVWVSTVMMAPPSQLSHVEVTQIEEKSWSVEVQDMSSKAEPAPQQTAAVLR